MDLDRARVLLTGATGGLGEAIALRLAADGARLVLCGRREQALAALAGRLGPAHETLVCDLESRDAVAALPERAGAIDVFVANAAVPASGPATEYTVQQLDRALDVNLRAPIALALALAPAMCARGRGHIVLMSSLSGKSGQAGTAIYSATKFGLRGFGQGLRGDLRPSGVGVSVVFPGFIRDAGMFHDSHAELPKGVGTSTPQEVADAVAHAISADKGEVTVAPVAMRLGTAFAALAPDRVAALAGRVGGDRVAADVADGQRHLR